MNQTGLIDMLERGEGISVEFKRCSNVPEHDTFETICSFANRQGGNILLGVENDGTVVGVNEKNSLDNPTQHRQPGQRSAGVQRPAVA